MKKSCLIFGLLIMNVGSFCQNTNTLTDAEKIYGLSRFWQEVNYNFANFDNVPTLNWDSTYIAYIPKILASHNDLEYYKLLKRFSALLNDAHTEIFFPKRIDTTLLTRMFGDYQIFLENIENKVIVSRINLNKKDEIPIGSEILEVNNKTSEDYLQEYVLPFISASTDYVRKDFAVRWMLQGDRGQQYEIKIKTPSGQTKTFFLTHQRTIGKEIYPKEDSTRNNLFNFRWINDKIAYVALNSFSELKKAKALILDIRYNGGGSSIFGEIIASYLTKDTLLTSSIIDARINNGLYRARGEDYTVKDTIGNPWRANCWLNYHNKSMINIGTDQSVNKTPDSLKIIIPTVVLIGHMTCSAAEEFLLFLDPMKQIVKMGENSNGSNGQPLYFDLPGGGSARICTQRCAYTDGRKYVGCGVKPDIEVKRTIDDLINNRDGALDEAVKYLSRIIQ